MKNVLDTFDPELDLLMERVIDVPPELVWKAWTVPEHLKVWFCPKPWQITECEIDLRPGGAFNTTMRGPDGEETAGTGCYLEIEENRRLVWTDAMKEGYRPNAETHGCIDGTFTAFVILEPHKKGTKYTVLARHGNKETRKQHLERGFEDGWGTALDQLVEYVKTWN